MSTAGSIRSRLCYFGPSEFENCTWLIMSSKKACSAGYMAAKKAVLELELWRQWMPEITRVSMYISKPDVITVIRWSLLYCYTLASSFEFAAFQCSCWEAGALYVVSLCSIPDEHRKWKLLPLSIPHCGIECPPSFSPPVPYVRCFKKDLIQL